MSDATSICCWLLLWKWPAWNFILEILESGCLDARPRMAAIFVSRESERTHETPHLHRQYKVVDPIKSYNFYIESIPI